MKTFFITFKVLSVARNGLRPDSASLISKMSKKANSKMVFSKIFERQNLCEVKASGSHLSFNIFGSPRQ